MSQAAPVLEDVIGGNVARDRAEAVYGVVPAGVPAGGTPTVEETAIDARRAVLAVGSAVPPPNVGRFEQG